MLKARRKKRTPKRVLALPDLEQSRAAVLNSLTFNGTGDDIAKAPELDRLRFLISRQPKGPSRVDTTMIEGADVNVPALKIRSRKS